MTPSRSRGPRPRFVPAARAGGRVAPLLAVGLAVGLGLAGCGEATCPPLAGAPTADGAAAPTTATVTVFAAASLTETFEAAARAFEAEHPGVAVRASYDGSSVLVRQLCEGASADVVATADHQTMAELFDAGLLAGEPVDFASNTLVLAVPKGNPASITTVADLAQPGIRVSICADGVPCGTLAAQALAAADVRVPGASEEQSVSAVAAKLAAGDVDAGFVYATDVAASDGAIQQAAVPDGGVSTEYPIALLAHAPQAGWARQFLDFVRSAAGQAILAQAGFGAP